MRPPQSGLVQVGFSSSIAQLTTSAFPIINHDLTIGPTTAVVTALRELVLQ
jgi:hypothetical protein